MDRQDRIPAWRPLIAVAERACATAGVQLSYKTVYEDISMMTVGGAPSALLDLLDALEAIANTIDPQTGALRTAESRASDRQRTGG
jgi:precorrin isomerase